MAATEKGPNPATLRDNGKCFVCGEKNSDGLRLRFELKGEELRARFRPDPKFQGYAGIVHGGILATVLDEAMVNLVFRLGHPVVSGDLKVRFLRPGRLEEDLEVRAWVDKRRPGAFAAAAELTGPDGGKVATATALLMELPSAT